MNKLWEKLFVGSFFGISLGFIVVAIVLAVLSIVGAFSLYGIGAGWFFIISWVIAPRMMVGMVLWGLLFQWLFL